MIDAIWQFGCITNIRPLTAPRRMIDNKRDKMPLRITQMECNHSHENLTEKRARVRPHDCYTLLKVEGSLYLEDAELLERVCRDIQQQTEQPLTLDLADLSFLDSDSASVLCRLKREQNVTLEGLHLFIAKVIELTEAEAMVSEYLPRVDQRSADIQVAEESFHDDTNCSDTIHRRVATTAKRNI
jgi:anti-anti-sigma regulatory factor